ncbi:MAG: imidazole glycerol phosphate synthase subunit HisF [Planctomycetota bacterium]|nr:imidazole glycerol phosphate synthase subunit HisF [Planctomycetota bacterium]
MLTRRIIPCLDVRDGRVVKGVQFSGLRDAGSPAELAQRYEAQGADELVMLDVSATPEGRQTQLETVRAIREVLFIPLTVGGGVRSVEQAQALLEAGADKVSMNTAAFERPQLITQIADRFGRQCTVVAIDAATNEQGSWEVVTLSGQNRTGVDAIEWARQCEQKGGGEILLTCWDRDGTQSGYELDLIKQVTQAVSIPIIASGGAANASHLNEAIDAGASAVLVASILHDGLTTVESLKTELRNMNVEVRL